MNHTISNGILEITVSETGAELQSLKSLASGREYLWQGDPAFWSGRAPILFPICGALKDSKYFFQGKEYTLPKHGFARNMDFEYAAVSDTSFKFTLANTEETIKNYPFEFTLEVVFRLDERKLYTDYIVRNHTDGDMLYSVGAHEAYNCPLNEGESFDDYYIEFEKPVELTKYPMIDEGIFDGTSTRGIRGVILNLRHQLFVDDALVFKNIEAKKVWFKSRKSKQVVCYDFNGAANLLLWTLVGAPYVCIEPWTGLPDSADSDGDFYKKDSITLLKKGEESIFTHSIEISE